MEREKNKKSDVIHRVGPPNAMDDVTFLFFSPPPLSVMLLSTYLSKECNCMHARNLMSFSHCDSKHLYVTKNVTLLHPRLVHLVID